MRYVVGKKSIIGGFFSVLLFAGYFASITFGESFWLTLTLIIGIAGLVFGAILSRNARVPDLPSWRANPFNFSLVMWGFYFLAQYTSVFFHEWSHSTVAFLLGVIPNEPLDINYGHGWTLSGLSEFDDWSVYPNLIEHGRGTSVAMIAIAGPMMNVTLAVISLALLTRERVRRSLLLFSLLFWVALHNVAQLWSYIPQRSVMYQGGDFFFFDWGLDLSPWAVTVPGTLFIIAGFVLVFVYVFPALLASLRPALPGLVGLFVLGWFTAFVHYGLTPLMFTLDSWTSPRVWFGVLDIAVGIIIALLFVRELMRKHVKNPWILLRGEK
ncbi:MAG TPA: hypothetical protein VMW63_07975 [Methanoregulaceae archaeon]|nr:hypothetical protein [Methanoregulaceae archaeon]